MFVYTEETNNNWTDVNVFYSMSLTAGFEVRVQTTQGMSDGGSYSHILIKKVG